MSTWNITVEDTSPGLVYAPWADGPLNGWSTWYKDVGFRTQAAQFSPAESYHITNGQGSSMSFSFFGTGIELVGSSNTSYSVTIDDDTDNNLTPTGDVLYSRSNLKVGSHKVTLTSHSSALDTILMFDKANLLNENHNDAISITPTRVDNSQKDLIKYSGSGWSIANLNEIPNPSDPQPFHKTSKAGDSLTFNVTGAFGFAIYGSLSVDHARYSVAVDGGSPNFFAGNSSWLVSNTTLFWQIALNESETHQVQMVDIDSSGLSFSFVDFFGHNVQVGGSGVQDSPPSSSKVNVGAIAGGVVGGVVGIALLIVLFLLWRRRRRGNHAVDKIEYGGAPPDNFSLGAQDSPISHDALVARPFVNDSSNAPSNNGNVYSGSHGQIPSSKERALREQQRLYPQRHTPQHSTSQLSNGGLTNSDVAPSNPSVDIDRIVELVAQRIDNSSTSGSNQGDTPVPPPYRGR